MKVIQYKCGDYIHRAGEICNTLELIANGKTELRHQGFSINLKKGSIIGSLETPGMPYIYDYVAAEDLALGQYEYKSAADLEAVIGESFSSCDVLVTAGAAMVVSSASKYRYYKKQSEKFTKILKNGYEAYKELCGLNYFEIQSFPIIDELEDFIPEKEIPNLICDYYDQIEIMPKEAKMAFFGTHISLPIAAVEESIHYASDFLKVCEQAYEHFFMVMDKYFSGSGGDLFELCRKLAERAYNENARPEFFLEVDETVEKIKEELEAIPHVPKDRLMSSVDKYRIFMADIKESKRIEENGDIYKPILHSLDIILKYACLDEGEEDRFRQLVRAYKSINDKNSSEEPVRRLRLEISKSFFDIYEAAILSSFEEKRLPVVLKMFFCFGYMDEALIGRENALKLYRMAEKMQEGAVAGVYTIYDWLRSIYRGENEPSKNELDQDYLQYLKSQRQGGYITEEMEQRYASSRKEKVRFEIHNFFKNAMKIASGRPSVFCPILSEHNVIKALETSMVTGEAVLKNWNIIRSIDYSCFYRETVYQNEEFRISREPILLEVLPTVILIPGIGQRSGIWQETAGVRRDTPARTYVPIFTGEDLFLMQLKMAGEFRWEICKKIQGARWNDVSDHSLTSDYFDYLQFYRKNNELSPDAKEKLKMSLTSNKNSFKNVFVSDYIAWIRYESQGSPRLNKVAKELMYTYCPFSKAVRKKLVANPMYTELIKAREAKDARNHKVLDAHYSKMKNKEGELPPEIVKYINFYLL